MGKDAVRDFIKSIEDMYGEEAIITQEDLLSQGVISTGSLALDVSLGIGGIPRGAYTEISGPESSGKTTLALSIAKQALEQEIPVLYLDAERSLDYRYARAIIGDFDEDLFVIVSPDTAEDFFSAAEDAISSNVFGLIILDSLGGVSPKKEKEDDLTKANIALLPRLLTKWLRRNSFLIKNNKIAFVFLNQVRAKIGEYGHGYSTPGGHALKHFEAIKITLTKGGKIESIVDKKKVIDGIIIKFTVVKNKLAPPFRGATIPLIFGHGVDYYRDVLEFTASLGVVRRAGSYYRFGDGDDIITLGQGIVKAKEYLVEHPETLDKILKMCYNVLGLKINKGETDEKED